MFKRLTIISAMTAFTLAMGSGGVRAAVIGDLVLVMDESGSVSSTEFEIQRQFGLDIINSFGFGLDAMQVGIATYSTSPRTIINLTADQSVAVNALQNVSPLGGLSNYAPAIDLGADILFGVNSRPAVPKVMIFFAEGPDGGTNFAASAAAAAGLGITTLAVGFGDCGADCLAELLTVANGIPEHSFFIRDFGSFGSFVRILESSLTVNPSGVPEPSVGALFGFGLAVLGFAWTRRRAS